MKYFTELEIANPPSLLDGYTIEVERSNRKSASILLNELGKKLTLYEFIYTFIFLVLQRQWQLLFFLCNIIFN
jgi:hypothetical protein